MDLYLNKRFQNQEIEKHEKIVERLEFSLYSVQKFTTIYCLPK